MSICLHSASLIIGPTDLKFSTHIKDHHISNLKVKVIGQGHQGKKCIVFSLVSEKVVQVQGNEGQRSKLKVKIKGHRDQGQRS